MYRFLRQPRWIALILFVPVAVFVFILLSRWQYHRYEARVAVNTEVAQHDSIAPVPTAEVMPIGSNVGPEQQWRLVTATGKYDSSAQVLVRQRPQNNENGFWVVTPLITVDGRTLVVNRGWYPAGSGATSKIDPPAAPLGVVSITGRVQPSAAGPAQEPADIPSGQISDLDVSKFAAAATTPTYPGYVNLTASDPAQATGLTPIALPPQETGSHLSYAMQWIAFAIMFVVGLGILIRREVRFLREQEDEHNGVERKPKRQKREERELWDDDEYPGLAQSGEPNSGGQDSQVSRTP